MSTSTKSSMDKQTVLLRKKYNLIVVGTKKSLILKRKSDFDPVVKTMPTKKYNHILRKSQL
ncbi:hypothetical protein ILUMI_12396, partial [Ignelater luminosus]